MPTSSPSNVTSEEKPPNSSATPTAKSPPKSSTATTKKKEKEKKPTTAAAGKGSMGARLSTTPGSAGKAPSTASASSTHTASTVPADGAEAKAKSRSGGGVTGFLRRKPSTKEPTAGPSCGSAAKKDTKDTKKGVGNTLRTSLFRRSTKSKNGADVPGTATGSVSGSSGTSTASATTNSAGAKPSPSIASASAKPASGSNSSAEKGRPSPEKGRTSPEKGRASSDKSPAARRGASPPKSQRPSSRTESSSAESSKKSPSPRPGAAATASRSSQALTPERKEALKKQWFTDGKPLPEPAGRGRATSRTGAGAGSRTEPRSRPGAGETVGPPVSASRVSGSAFSTAAAKFGGVKAPAKPRPGSPKKSDKLPTSPKKTTGAPGSPKKKVIGAPSNPKKSEGAPGSPKKSGGALESAKKSDISANPATEEGLGDLMDAMAEFKTGADKSEEAKTEEENTKSNSKLSVKDETVSCSVSTDMNVKADPKAPAIDVGLDDLMGAMEGFNPNGSKTDKSENGRSKNGVGSPESDNADKGKDKTTSEVVSVKDESRTLDENDGNKEEKDVKTNDRKESSKDITKKDDELAKNATATASKADAKDVSDDESVSARNKDDSEDAKEKNLLADAVEPKAEKTSTWRHGDSDGGELGLGGISQKDREERSHRPSAPKDQTVNLDFLIGQIDTAPKPPAAEPKSPEKKASPKAVKKFSDKDAGLGDLMDLAKGFDMSAMSRSEPTAAQSSAAPEFAPSDMDKFLDMIDTTPAKSVSPPTGPPVKEEDLVKKDTWRTGDGDDEAMIALMNKPRDKDAPSQAPEWNIEDLLVGDVTKKPEPKDDKSVKSPGGKVDKGGLSGFDDFIGDSLSGDVAKVEDKQSADSKVKHSADHNREHDKSESEKAFSGFDDFLSESLFGKDSPSAADSKKAADKSKEKELADKKPSEGEFAAFDDFLSGSLSAGGDSDKTADKPAEKKPADKKQAAGEFSGFDDFLSSSLSGKESAGSPLQEDPVAAPKKLSVVDSAPPAVAEEIVAAVTTSQTTAAPGKLKPVSDKHLSKEGNTRGSVPDHGHGVRDLLYDDKDKTGTKPSGSREDPKSREPAMLDALILPTKASNTSSAPPAADKEETVVAQTVATTEAGKPSGKKVCGEHREKSGNTRGSVPDHGHGVRDVLYDDSDKTGHKKSGSKEDSKPREPAILEDLIQPRKAAASHAAPDEHQAHSSDNDEEEEEEISAETAHQSQASSQASGKKKRKSRKKKHAKEGDTRGSVPDHGHGVRDVLYDDGDKTGRKKTPSGSKDDAKARKPAVLDDLIQPKKATVSHALPVARTPSPEAKKTEELVTAETAHQAHAAAAPSGKKYNKKKQGKEGDTRGSVPDHGHGARDVLYDDKDKTGRRKSDPKEEAKPRDPVVLDDLIQPKKAAVSHAAAPAKKSPSRSPSPDEEEEEVSAETAHQSQASSQAGGKKKRRSKKKKHAKEGDVRGSVPDHGHAVRDVPYDGSDKTGRKKTGANEDVKQRQPELLDDLIRPANVTETASAPSSHSDSKAATHDGGAERPLVAENVSTAQGAPSVAAAPPSPKHQEPARKSLSLAGMTDPDLEDSDDGEELRRLIASTEALHAQLQDACHGDSKQAHAVQEQTGQELERLERSLEQRERRLETAGRGQEVLAAKEGLKKVKQQLDASRAGGAAAQ